MKNLSFATRPKQIVIVLLFQWNSIFRNLHQIHFPTGQIVTQEEHYWGRTKEQIYWTNCRVNWDGYQKEVIPATPNKSLTTIATLFSAKSILFHLFVPQSFIRLLIATLSNKYILYSYSERKNAPSTLSQTLIRSGWKAQWSLTLNSPSPVSATKMNLSLSFFINMWINSKFWCVNLENVFQFLFFKKKCWV